MACVVHCSNRIRRQSLTFTNCARKGRLPWGSAVWGRRGPSLGVEWGCAPLLGGPHERGRFRAGRTQTDTPRPQMLARNRPRSWGGARWGATSAWCALGNPCDFGRKGSQGAPRQAPGRHTEPSGSVWRPDRLAPSHRYPAVAGAQAFGESPSKGSRPPSTHAVGVGLGPFKGVFAGQYGLIFPNLKGTNSGSWKPALQAQLLRPVGAWISEQARRRASAMSCGDAPLRGEWENPSKSPDVIRGSWDVLTASQKLLVDPGEPY